MWFPSMEDRRSDFNVRMASPLGEVVTGRECEEAFWLLIGFWVTGVFVWGTRTQLHARDESVAICGPGAHSPWLAVSPFAVTPSARGLQWASLLQRCSMAEWRKPRRSQKPWTCFSFGHVWDERTPAGLLRL